MWFLMCISGPVSPATSETTEEDVVNDQPESTADAVYFEPSSPVAVETRSAARRRAADSEGPLDLSLPKRRRQQ